MKGDLFRLGLAFKETSLFCFSLFSCKKKIRSTRDRSEKKTQKKSLSSFFLGCRSAKLKQSHVVTRVAKLLDRVPPPSCLPPHSQSWSSDQSCTHRCSSAARLSSLTPADSGRAAASNSPRVLLTLLWKKGKKSNGCTLAEEYCVTSNQLRERKKCIAALAWSSSAPWKIKYFANLFCGLFLVEGGLEVQKQICWLVVAAAAAKTSSKAKTGSSSKLRMTIVLFLANLNLQINFA